MADGCGAHRDYPHRLSCWAHLICKARAPAETFTPHAQGDARALLATFDLLIVKVNQAREGPPADLRARLAAGPGRFQALRAKMSRSRNAQAA
jgi:hypothetical protein